MYAEETFLVSGRRETEWDRTLSKWIPRIALIISICAFIFQTTVLYPWHLELSAEFAQLAAQVKNATGK
jgi:hypothetical protein